MRRATNIIHFNNWKKDEVVGTVTLSYQERHRRRIKMLDDDGFELLLDLVEVAQIEEGDALALKDGGVVVVKAADEDVLDIRCETKEHAARIAWHIGNRHTPLRVIDDGTLRIIYDHVLEKMLIGLNAETSRNKAAFSPERGAYSTPGHSHGHYHDE